MKKCCESDNKVRDSMDSKEYRHMVLCLIVKETEIEINDTIIKDLCAKFRIATAHGSKGYTYNNTLVYQINS